MRVTAGTEACDDITPSPKPVTMVSPNVSSVREDCTEAQGVVRYCGDGTLDADDGEAVTTGITTTTMAEFNLCGRRGVYL